MDLFDRILELSRYGYFCSQILAILMLETTGEENPGLVRAMGGLNGGVGFSGGCCGCMTGGACGEKPQGKRSKEKGARGNV